MYEEKFGIKPEKQANITCSIKKLDSSAKWVDVWK